MNCKRITSLILAILTAMASLNAQPYIEKNEGKTRLIVNGEPFLMIAGESSNSASGSLEYMASLWPAVKQINLNTLLVPVCWDMIEPIEGHFDFSIVEGIIHQARENGMKLTLLWFGSWKNMVSSYAPSWVKLNRNRFPVLQDKNGGQIQMLSVFSENNWEADSKAFSALMGHIRDIDSKEQTVVMMQVENEVGYSFGERDWSKLAQKAYNSAVPKELLTYISENQSRLIPEFKDVWAANGSKTNGTWEEVFGNGAECNEIFMSYYYASYIGKVVEAGKKQYDIPMFANASVGRQDRKIATYPCGGPIPFVMDVWHCAAPALDAISPDIYYGDFNGHCADYIQNGNPLIIPETNGGMVGTVRSMIAYANYDAICFSPFGIERYVGDPIGDAYAKYAEIAPLILKSRPGVDMVAVGVDSNNLKNTVKIGGYRVLCEFGHRGNVPANQDAGGAIIIKGEKDEFYVLGVNVSLQFSLVDRGRKNLVTGILDCEEGTLVNGEWKASRRLNGDQIMNDYSFDSAYLDGRSGNGLRFSSIDIQRVKLYSF